MGRMVFVSLCSFLALMMFANAAASNDEILDLILNAEPMPLMESNDIPFDNSDGVAVRHAPDVADISWWLLSPPDSYVNRGSHESTKDGEKASNISDTTQWPYRTVCKLYMRYGYNWSECSGAFIVDNHLVFTAGHCLYDYYSGEWADEVIVVPAKNGYYEPYGSKAGYNWYVGSGWYNSGSSNDDWGVVEVDAFSTGWMDNRIEDTSWYTGKTFQTAGYPAAYGYSGTDMWYDYGTCTYASDYRIWVDFGFKGTCIPGQSGSAIWYQYGSSR